LITTICYITLNHALANSNFQGLFFLVYFQTNKTKNYHENNKGGKKHPIKKSTLFNFHLGMVTSQQIDQKID
jgi:hypothetical protein